MKEPFLYEGDEDVSVSVAELGEIVKALTDLGRYEEFTETCQEKSLSLNVPKETVNELKKYLFKIGAHKECDTSRAYITSATCKKKSEVYDTPELDEAQEPAN